MSWLERECRAAFWVYRTKGVNETDFIYAVQGAGGNVRFSTVDRDVYRVFGPTYECSEEAFRKRLKRCQEVEKVISRFLYQ